MALFFFFQAEEGIRDVAVTGVQTCALPIFVGTLEFAGIPITGASLWTLAACRRKPIANALLQQAGLAIPRWTVAQGKIEDDFPLPAIVKPAAEDASAGLDRGSVVSDRKSLRARLAAMTEQFDEVLVQEYIGGREVHVGLLGNRGPPVAESRFTRLPPGARPLPPLPRPRGLAGASAP